ncbi:MAG TPA: FixH family protein [Fluviicola sp.]|nr:FixH family protein [Fluviicola sp.]
MNWGKGLAIGMILFMTFILTMVFIMMRQDIDLVREDYYQHELEFNQQYDEQKTYIDAPEKLKISVNSDTLFIQMPEGFDKDTFSLHLQRPNNELLDFKITLHAAQQVKLPVKSLSKGNYTCFIRGFYINKPYQMNAAIKL